MCPRAIALSSKQKIDNRFGTRRVIHVNTPPARVRPAESDMLTAFLAKKRLVPRARTFRLDYPILKERSSVVCGAFVSAAP